MKKHKSKSTYSTSRRDTFVIARPRLPVALPRSRVSPLILFEDRRRFHPSGIFAPAKTLHGSLRFNLKDRHYATVKPSPFNSFPRRSQTKAALAFHAPNRVLVCVRRRRRKEVLFAQRKTGRLGQRRPRRNLYSSISC